MSGDKLLLFDSTSADREIKRDERRDEGTLYREYLIPARIFIRSGRGRRVSAVTIET